MITNIFSILKQYAAKWQETEARPFTEEEISAVVDNEIIASEYGNSVCFLMVNGSKCYIPCDRDCTKGVGEKIDMHKAIFKTLSKPGEDDIYRVLE